jgi:PAS domain S-box-containing protein
MPDNLRALSYPKDLLAMPSSEGPSGWLAHENGPDHLDEGLFRAHFDMLPGAGYIWKRTADEDFQLIAHNRAATLLAEGDVRDLLGTRASELLKAHPDLRRALHQCADELAIVVQEADVTFVSGVRLRMLITRLPLSPDIVVVHMEDVTERRAAEAVVKASERRFRALFQSHPDLVFRMDVGGTYLDVHVPEGATLPLPLEDLIGRNIADVFGPEAAAQHWHYARKAVQTDEVQTIEYEAPIGGSDHQVESRFVSCGGNEVVVNVRDITERVELEQALTDGRERERTRLGAALQNQVTQLRDRVEWLKDTLRSAPRPGEFDRAIAALEATVSGADELARNLVPVGDGTPLIAALNDLATHTEQSLGIACRLAHSNIVPAMILQAPDLYRIAQEAIANAVEHGNATEIEIICGVVNEQFVLNIVDNGTGFRLSTADNAGLGMRIMRHRAKRLGGNLTRSRRAGGGTMLTCTCPLARALRSDQKG